MAGRRRDSMIGVSPDFKAPLESRSKVRASDKDANNRTADLTFFVSLAWLFLGSLPAVADVYPVNGVWAAPHPQFPISADEACFTVKVVGVEAVARKSIAHIIIFAGLQSAKLTDGGYWITELPTERRRFWFRQKVI